MGNNPPPIPPARGNLETQPLLSVMIPAYEPGDYLRKTLHGILAQDQGAAVMQIAVVDDASPTVDIAALLRDAAPAGRVEVHRNDSNLGLAGNWNRCVELARGRFVHLLHQDDLILPDFYASLLRGFDVAPEAGMAFCRHAFVDEAGSWTQRSRRERWTAGILSHWLQRISEKQRIQCPAAIVRRDVYVALGGFRNDLRYALDWEMWTRIAARYPVWYEPAILACYRRHDANETARLAAAGLLGADLLRAVEIFSQHVPAQSRCRLRHKAYRRIVRSHLRSGVKLLHRGFAGAASEQLAVARAALHQLPDGIVKRCREQQLTRLEARCAARAAA